MQAANVRSVGELFGSAAQESRISQLEAEVRELRALVEALGARGMAKRSVNLRDVRSVDGLVSLERVCSVRSREPFPIAIRPSRR